MLFSRYVFIIGGVRSRNLTHTYTVVSDTDINDTLTRALSTSEIKADVFAIHPEKAQWPGGMTTLFYQKFWHIIGSQVLSMVQEFMTFRMIDPSLNEVNICLIPKSERRSTMKEFRPITLCNVSYMIISKVLC